MYHSLAHILNGANLGLYHTVLLRNDQHDQAMSNTIGLSNIQELHAELLSKYVDQDTMIEKAVFNELVNVFRVSIQ